MRHCFRTYLTWLCKCIKSASHFITVNTDFLNITVRDEPSAEEFPQNISRALHNVTYYQMGFILSSSHF